VGIEFGKRLREARERKGLTQLELAKLANLGESTISFYELGRREPNYDILIRLAEILEVSPNYLLTGKDNGYSSHWWLKEEPPSVIELWDFIENHSNLKLMGYPLDEEAKQEILLAMRVALEHIKKEEEKKKGRQKNGQS